MNQKDNYTDEVIEAALKMVNSNKYAKGGVAMINVKHDSWCGIFKRKPCNCNPIVETSDVHGNA